MFGPICMFGRHLRAGPRPHIRPFAAGRSPTRERTSTHPVQNSPNTPPPAAQPVQNSPNTPKKAHFSPFCTSRENFLPHPAPRPPAGRTLYRAQCQTRYKTLPAPPPAAQPVQNSPNTPKKAHFSTFYPSRENFLPHPAPRRPAGRTLYRAQCQTRYKTPPTRPRQQPTRYKTLPAPPFYSDSAKKFAQHTPHHNRTAKNFAQHT